MSGGKSPSKLPIAYPSPYRSSYNTASSPPKLSSLPRSAATSAVPSLISDSGSSASARSADNGMADVDLLDMLDLKLSHSVKAEPLDRGIAKQAQA